jgi:hypothetical protein
MGEYFIRGFEKVAKDKKDSYTKYIGPALAIGVGAVGARKIIKQLGKSKSFRKNHTKKLSDLEKRLKAGNTTNLHEALKI